MNKKCFNVDAISPGSPPGMESKLAPLCDLGAAFGSCVRGHIFKLRRRHKCSSFSWVQSIRSPVGKEVAGR